MTEVQPRPWMVVLAFACVYLFWGSTYLGIRIAVEDIPPGLMCAVRFLIAGVLMLGYCALTGRTVRYGAARLVRLAIVGTLLLMGGNLILSYAEKVVPSGLASLVVACTPLWFLLLDSLILGKRHIPARGVAGLGLGVAGIAVLMWPKITTIGSLGGREVWWSLSLLVSSFSWALGSVMSKRWQSADVDILSGTSWQVIFAGLANLIFALLFEDVSGALWTPRGVSAILYLVVGGSWIGFTAYIWLLRHVSISKAATYAYVNPVVAVFLGWLLANERVDGYILAGSAIVVASVALVTTAKESA